MAQALTHHNIDKKGAFQTTYSNVRRPNYRVDQVSVKPYRPTWPTRSEPYSSNPARIVRQVGDASHGIVYRNVDPDRSTRMTSPSSWRLLSSVQ